MSLLPSMTHYNLGGSYYALQSEVAAPQQLSQFGNSVFLSGTLSGGSVDIEATTTVAATKLKTTHQSLSGGIFTVFGGDATLIESTNGLGVLKAGFPTIQINGGVIEGNNPVVFTRAGTLKVLTITDNNDASGAAGQSLTSGAGGELVWATVGGGGVSVNAGTNISIPDPSIPVVSVAISSTLDMVQNTLDNAPLIQSSVDITLAPVGVAKILNATPTLRFDDTTTSVDVVYNPTGSQFSESALTTSAHEIGVYTGVVGENIAMGVDVALQVGYVTGQGLPLFVGESGQSSYSGLYLGNGNNPSDFCILDRKDNNDVTQTACSIAMTGAGIVNISSQLAGGDIGIVTNAVADIVISSGQNITMNANSEIQLQISGNKQARLAGGGNIGVGGSGSDGSVFLLKNDDSLYGAFNYNGGTDTLNMDNGGSSISVGATEIGLTSSLVKIVTSNLDMVLHNIINGNQIELVSDTARVLLSDATNTSKGDLNYSSLNNKVSLGALGSGTVLALTTASADLDLNAVGGHIQLLTTGNPIEIATNVDGLGNSGNIELTANGTGAISLTTGSTVEITGGNLDLNTNDLVDGGNLGAESMVLQSNLAKAEFKDALGVLKGSMGYNVGTDFMDLTGSSGFEIVTTAGALNMEANGGKINMITNGNNIELFANTTALVFGNVSIGSADGDIDIGTGGNVNINAGTTGGNITVTAFGDFSVSSATVKLPTLPTASTESQLFYDTSTKEVSYGPAFPAITVQAATGTIALTASMNRSTYILTGTSATQTFTDAGLTGVAAGWCVYLRNGNNATGLTRDITITITAGSVTLHAPTGTTNSAYVLLYWNGSALVAYR